MNTAPSSVLPVVHIRPGTRAVTFTLKEVWHARELLYFLVLRDIKVRYKQTVLGVAWSVLQPFLTMVVFTIFFGRLAKMPSDGVPYPLFSLAAVVPWTYFATAATNGSSSLVGNQHLLSKVYFPRVLVPLAAVLMPAVDLAVSFGMLIVLMAWYRVVPTASILTLPLFAALGVLTAFAVTLWTSALSVRYRDARYVLPFVIQIWLFVTPVAYPASMVPERWRLLYALNPMAAVVEGFRGALLGTPGAGLMTVVAVVVVLVGLVTGVAYFRSVEGSIVDLA
jgi:lipopolysaccharide transport system permease protein